MNWIAQRLLWLDFYLRSNLWAGPLESAKQLADCNAPGIREAIEARLRALAKAGNVQVHPGRVDVSERCTPEKGSQRERILHLYEEYFQILLTVQLGCHTVAEAGNALRDAPLTTRDKIINHIYVMNRLGLPWLSHYSQLCSAIPGDLQFALLFEYVYREEPAAEQALERWGSQAIPYLIARLGSPERSHWARRVIERLIGWGSLATSGRAEAQSQLIQAAVTLGTSNTIWSAEAIVALLDRYCRGWRDTPEGIAGCTQLAEVALAASSRNAAQAESLLRLLRHPSIITSLLKRATGGRLVEGSSGRYTWLIDSKRCEDEARAHSTAENMRDLLWEVSTIVESAASAVPDSDLRMILAIPALTVKWSYQIDYWPGWVHGEVPIDTYHLKNLACQELARRGQAATW